MSPKYLNSTIPFVAKLTKLFKTNSSEEVFEKYKDAPRYKTTDGLPDLIEIPVEDLIAAGFTIKAYLKTPNNTIVDAKDSGIVVVDIQHTNIEECLIRDLLSTKIDTKSEISLSTALSALVYNNNKEVFGSNYDINNLYTNSLNKMAEIDKMDEDDRKVRELTIKKFNENPELARKATIKALENLVYKQKQYNANKTKTQEDVAKFQRECVKLFETIGLANGGKLEGIKDIPEIKKLLEKNADFATILETLSKITQGLEQK